MGRRFKLRVDRSGACTVRLGDYLRLGGIGFIGVSLAALSTAAALIWIMSGDGLPYEFEPFHVYGACLGAFFLVMGVFGVLMASRCYRLVFHPGQRMVQIETHGLWPTTSLALPYEEAEIVVSRLLSGGTSVRWEYGLTLQWQGGVVAVDHSRRLEDIHGAANELQEAVQIEWTEKLDEVVSAAVTAAGIGLRRASPALDFPASERKVVGGLVTISLVLIAIMTVIAVFVAISERLNAIEWILCLGLHGIFCAVISLVTTMAARGLLPGVELRRLRILARVMLLALIAMPLGLIARLLSWVLGY
ncbi:hypothetical protein LCGC14_0339860 [marine sediment metagenome]|uniref:Uncharacterized protein n=1 Tax=marine sediment metagenome TaxID=412755 RepID=A0A0F9TJI2_9ZZZZ